MNSDYVGFQERISETDAAKQQENRFQCCNDRKIQFWSCTGNLSCWHLIERDNSIYRATLDTCC